MWHNKKSVVAEVCLFFSRCRDARKVIMEISDWRQKIDEVDRDLVRLLNERARVVLEIGKLKRQNGLAIQEPRREREVFQNIVEANQGPLESAAVQRMFQQIIEECRGLQQELFEKKPARKTVRKDT